MKRQALAVLVGSLFALPAFAFDGEINAGLNADTQPVSGQPSQVREWRGFDGEIGNTTHAAVSNKTRAEVMAEIDGARAVDGETGSPLPHA